MSVQRSVKVVVVGDGAVGKTSMLMSFVEGRMPEEYVPTVFENHAVSQKIEQTGEVITMNLWDTAGQVKKHFLSIGENNCIFNRRPMTA